MKETIKNTRTQLDELKKKVIGLFIYGSATNLVLEHDEKSGELTCVYSTPLAALSEMYINKSKGKYVPIPDQYSSFYDLLEDVVAFHEWYNEKVQN